MTEMKTIPHITPEELHDFWPNGFDAGEVAGVCERAAAEIERLSRERDTGVPEVLALIDDTCLECRQNALLLDGEDGIRSQAAGDVLQKLGDEVRAMLSTLRKRRRLDVT